MFFLLFQRDIQLAFRRGGGALGGVAFYVMLVTLFTFGTGAEQLQQSAKGVFCVGLVLSTLIGLPSLLEHDLEDGTFEQFLLQPITLEWLIFSKLLAHWASNSLPLLVITPFLAMMADTSWPQTVDILLALLLLGPTATAIGAIGAALCLGKRYGSLLQALIILPLLTPALIFASAQVDKGGIAFLIAALLASIPLSCLATAALVRAEVE